MCIRCGRRRAGGPLRGIATSQCFKPFHATEDAELLRGTAAGLEFVFTADGFDAGWDDVSGRLAERPAFYRGSHATAIFEGCIPSDADVAKLLAGAQTYGIALRGLYGGDGVAEVAARHALAFLGKPPRPTVASFERKRAARAERVTAELTDEARSLEPDFAGARADIAKRRARGEPSVSKPVFAPPVAAVSDNAAVAHAGVAAVPGPLYHRGTLRGGQTLQQLGTIIVVGDVNPGAELVATGDIVVFGSLRGTAHAGAQGDATARVFALELAPTQLRIAACIAADDGTRRARVPEVAYIEGDRIAIVPHHKNGKAR